MVGKTKQRKQEIAQWATVPGRLLARKETVKKRMVKFLAKLAGNKTSATGVAETQTTPVPTPFPAPKRKSEFLFPDTEEEYLRRRTEIMEKAEATATACLAEAVRLSAEADGLLAERPELAARQELNRRWAENLRVEATRLRKEADEAKRKTWQQVNTLLDLLKQNERELVASGKGIFTSTSESGQTTRYSEGSGNGFERTERRVVEFRGQVWLACVVSTITTRETGGHVHIDVYEGTHEGGGYRSMRTPERVPTGEYGSPVVKWVTMSMSQFSDEELRAVVQFQQSSEKGDPEGEKLARAALDA